MGTRNGLVTLQVIARQLCRAVTFFSPALRAQYRDNAALIAALNAAEEVCRLLPPALEDVIEKSGFNDPLIDNPYATPGILGGDPAPEPPEPQGE